MGVSCCFRGEVPFSIVDPRGIAAGTLVDYCTRYDCVFFCYGGFTNLIRFEAPGVWFLVSFLFFVCRLGRCNVRIYSRQDCNGCQPINRTTNRPTAAGLNGRVGVGAVPLLLFSTSFSHR